MNILTAGTETPEVNDALAKWAAVRIWGEEGAFGPPYTTMGIYDEETLVAVLVYHNYYKRYGTIEMSGAADTPQWLTRPVLWNIFAYPFLQLGCQMVTMRNDPADRALQRILKSIGFESIRVPNMRGRGKDEMFHMLTDEAWGQSRFTRRMAERKAA